MPSIGILGGSKQQRSLPQDAQRSVNLYPVLDQQGADVGSMYGTPGLALFGTAGLGPGRSSFSSANGRAFAIIGSGLYEINAAGQTTLLGSLNQSQGICTMAENGLQLAICDGVNLYILTYATNAFAQVMGGVSYITDGDFSNNPGPWTTGTGWTLTTGAANASNASSDLSQTASNTLVSGKTYTLTYTVARTAGTITPKIGGTAGITRSAPGTYTETIVAGSTQIIAFTGAGFSGSVSAVSVSDNASGFTTASTVTFIDGYFVISIAQNTGKFQISGLYDGFTWASLSFATAESSPDGLLRAINVSGQLWLLGSRSIEIWSDTGALNFPFQRVSGAKIEQGTVSSFASISLDNSLFWVGTDINGAGIVYRADGFSPQRISTETIERRIAQASDFSTIRCMGYQEEGHSFLLVTGGGMETTLVYDLATQLWHERAYLTVDGTYTLHLAADMMFAFNRHIVLDRTNGNIYTQSLDYYSDNGDVIARDRIFTHLIDENQRVKYSNLTVNFETGVGNQIDPASQPQATLSFSNDGGRTWVYSSPQSIGAIGQYQTRVVWYRLGQARIRTYRIRVTDPVKVAITGAYLNTR